MRLDIKYPKEYQPSTKRAPEWHKRMKRIYAEAEARVAEKLGPKRKNIEGLRRGWGSNDDH